MTRRTLSALVAALAVLGLGGALAYAAASHDMTKTPMTSTMEMGTSTGMSLGHSMLPHGPNFDRAFIDNMVPHHQAAVAMARIELATGKRQALRSLARSIIADQRSEIGQMKQWRLHWYGSAKTPAKMIISMPGMNIATLKNAADVDHAFLTQMIPHHESAIQMATQAKTDGHRQEVRSLATRIIKAQQREISVMQHWRKTWYG